ncbi:hypothetical protein MRX96_049135 [Rhipicephalus microplus]
MNGSENETTPAPVRETKKEKVVALPTPSQLVVNARDLTDETERVQRKEKTRNEVGKLSGKQDSDHGILQWASIAAAAKHYTPSEERPSTHKPPDRTKAASLHRARADKRNAAPVA